MILFQECNNSFSLTHECVQYWQMNMLLPKLKSDPWNRKDVAMEKWSNTQCSCEALMNRIFFKRSFAFGVAWRVPTRWFPWTGSDPQLEDFLLADYFIFFPLDCQILTLIQDLLLQIYIQLHKSVTSYIKFTILGTQFNSYLKSVKRFIW